MLSPVLSLALLTLPLSASAFSTFDPTCTLPSDPTNFTAASPVRSSIEILSSSLFAIFACTWTILHLNIPEQRQDRNPGLVGDVIWKLKGACTKALWLVTAIIVPEWMLGDAALQLVAAVRSCKAMKEFAAEDGAQWTLTHAFFANMGGLVVETIPGKDIRLEMASKGAGTSMQSTIPLHLMAESLFQLRKTNALTLPEITANQINDKSKGDAAFKLIVVLQVSTFILQVAVRFFRGLSISQLEISVLAFAATSIVTFMLLLYKPRDILIPLQIRTRKNPLPYNLVLDLVTKDRNEAVLSRVPQPDKKGHIYDRGVGNDLTYTESKYDIWSTYLGGAMFGGIHCLAWNFAFPSYIEQVLWRAASAATAGIPLLMLAGLFIFGSLPKLREKKVVKFAHVVSVGILGTVYGAGRLFILAEVFRSLFYLQPDTFVATWTAEIPKFG